MGSSCIFPITRLRHLFFGGSYYENPITVVKYGEGKSISIRRIELDSPHQLARFIIQDQGMGVSEEMQEKIFRRFERAVSSERISGLGLGLYITRQIVEAHDGSIRVKSQPRQGATFTVELPLISENASLVVEGVGDKNGA